MRAFTKSEPLNTVAEEVQLDVKESCRPNSDSQGPERHHGAHSEASECANPARSAQNGHAGDIVAANGSHAQPDRPRSPQLLSSKLSPCHEIELIVGSHSIVIVVLPDVFFELGTVHRLQENLLAFRGHPCLLRI